MSHSQSLLLVLTLQTPAREQSCTCFLSFSLSRPYIHSFVLYPVHWSISCLSVYWERVCTSPKPKFSSSLIVLVLLSSICRPLLCFKSLSINKKRSTMLADVTGTHRWLHCAREHGWGLETGTCSVTQNMFTWLCKKYMAHVRKMTLAWTHYV